MALLIVDLDKYLGSGDPARSPFVTGFLDAVDRGD